MDQEADLLQTLADTMARQNIQERDYYPEARSGAIYLVRVKLWQPAPQQRAQGGTITSWEKK